MTLRPQLNNPISERMWVRFPTDTSSNENEKITNKNRYQEDRKISIGQVATSHKWPYSNIYLRFLNERIDKKH